MTDAPAGPPSGRYGGPAPWRRTAVVAGSVLLATLALGWLAWATWFQATPQVSSQLVSWEVVDAHTVTADIDVVLHGHQDASCVVHAYAADHSVVGEKTYAPTSGRNHVQVRTERLATSVESVGCTTPDQHRPR